MGGREVDIKVVLLKPVTGILCTTVMIDVYVKFETEIYYQHVIQSQMCNMSTSFTITHINNDN